MGFSIAHRKATGSEWITLRKAVGWETYSEEVSNLGMQNSLYGVVALNSNGSAVGMGRVIGDGITAFFIADVIVNPDFQNKGVGSGIMKALMDYIHSTQIGIQVSKTHAKRPFVGLNAAKGKEEFYQKFGFRSRPTDYLGHGMQYVW